MKGKSVLEFTPLEFETTVADISSGKGRELEFTPLEFETEVMSDG